MVMATSDLLPLFPLPSVVLFPNVFLPLHIFEPRYREMVSDALSSDRLIGMVLLRPGWEHEYEGRPPVYPIGCTGLITHVERQSDGRFNIVLRGLDRFRVLEEDSTRIYRRATIQPLPDRTLDKGDREAIAHLRSRLEQLLTPTAERSGHEPRVPAAMSDEDLVNALAQYLDLEPLEKQALLEQPGVITRAAALVDLLEMKTMAARIPSATHVSH